MAKIVKPLIFVVEDDPSISEIVKYNLTREGYRVEVIDDGQKAWKRIRNRFPDMIILDWKLPSMSGLDLCYAMRQDRNTAQIPIIMISSKSQDIDKMSAFDTQIDDYMVKPFSPGELSSRIKAVLQRVRPAFFAERLEFEGISLNLVKHEVLCNGREVHLSPIEFQIMQLLLEQPTSILSRKFLKDKIWGDDIYVEERTIDVHITRLRKSLMRARTDGFDVIRTVRLAGYCLRHKHHEQMLNAAG